jgi:predicted phosphoribosyltransferase/dienelactone hydrolase
VTALTFADRADAGAQLSARLEHLRGHDVTVFGLTRGGVPVAVEVAGALAAPLDVVVVRKLGAPGQPELAMGAIGEDGVRVVDDDVLSRVAPSVDQLAEVERDERAELDRLRDRLRAGRPGLSVNGRTAVVVDDGVATGSSARAACQVARVRGAARVVLAVPVASTEVLPTLRQVADEVVCVAASDRLSSIGSWYDDFAEVSDEEVTDLLRRHDGGSAPPDVPVPPVPGRATAAGFDAEVVVSTGSVALPGRLTVPPGATGVVVFAHGSGSSRDSPRNTFVASVLNNAGLGTLLFDLLTDNEEGDRANVFDIGLLADRLGEAVAWLRGQPVGGDASIGLFGASTGAAAALWAATQPRLRIAAVVSRGGRPDLAGDRLDQVSVPTLLIVGGRDDTVIELNRRAQGHLRGVHRLDVVPEATHLFEEPGALPRVAELARDWFTEYLRQ